MMISTIFEKAAKKGAVLFAVFLLSITLFAAEDPFFANGKTDWVIVLGTKASPAEEYAAKELATGLKKISGADFKIVKTDAPPAANAVVIGSLDCRAVAAKADALGLKKGEVEQLVIRTMEGNLYLAGNQPRGALYAVYTFLKDELGVRWLWPGDDGEIMPAKKEWSLPELRKNYTPAIQYRGFHTAGDWNKAVPEVFKTWMARNFVNIHRHGFGRSGEIEKGFHIFYSSHNADLTQKTFEEHPEYFGEFNGRPLRYAPCFSNDKVLDLICSQLSGEIRYRQLDILGLMPPDTQEFCKCAVCRTKEPTELWFEFFNRVTDRLKKDFPKLKFSTIAYFWYRPVPKCEIRNAEFIEYASYDRCNIHPFGTPGCKQNEKTMKRMDEWDETPYRIGNYGYEFDVFNDNVMLPFYSVIADLIRNESRRRHKAVITEINWGPGKAAWNELWISKNRLGLYLYANLMWNPEQDLDELLRNYCAAAFGEAADPMFRYYKLLDNAWKRNSKHAAILGHASAIIPDILTDDVRKQVALLFDEASKKLGGKPNANLAHEKNLYSNLTAVKLPKELVLLPKHKSGTKEGGAKIPGCKAEIFWSDDAIHLTGVRCPFELVLNTGGDGETLFFAADASGEKKTWKISGVGVLEETWDPEWTFSAGNVTIPFRTTGSIPAADSLWRLHLTAGGARYPAEAETDAGVMFSDKAQPAKTVFWLTGATKTDALYANGMDKDFLNMSWKFSFATEQDLLTKTPDVYWFQNSAGNFSGQVWKKIREDVKNGAAVFFTGYFQIPLDKYFQDPSFAVKRKPIGKIALEQRKVSKVHPGKWLDTPCDVARQMRRCITPPYYYMPENPEAWTILAWMPESSENNNPGVPMLMVRPFGKGFVCVLGGYVARVSFSFPMLTENILANRDGLFQKSE